MRYALVYCNPWLLVCSLQPLGFENSQAVIVPLFFLVSINLLFNNWAKDQVRASQLCCWVAVELSNDSCQSLASSTFVDVPLLQLSNQAAPARKFSRQSTRRDTSGTIYKYGHSTYDTAFTAVILKTEAPGCMYVVSTNPHNLPTYCSTVGHSQHPTDSCSATSHDGEKGPHLPYLLEKFSKTRRRFFVVTTGDWPGFCTGGFKCVFRGHTYSSMAINLLIASVKQVMVWILRGDP